MEDLILFFQGTLNDNYWHAADIDYPRHNIDQTKDNNNCVEFILQSMKTKYPEKDWEVIEDEMKILIDKHLLL